MAEPVIDDKGAPAPTPTPTPNVGDFDAMRKTLPDELQGNEMVKTSKSFTSFVEQSVNAQKLIGSKISIPKDDDEKAWNEFYAKIGRPESADKYDIKRPVDSKLPYDEKMEKAFLTTAHKSGLSKRQAQGVLDWWNKEQETIALESEKVRTSAVAELKKEWGSEYEAKVAVSQRALLKYGDKELVKFLEDTGLGNNPAVVRMFSRIGDDSREEKTPRGEPAGDMVGAEAKKEIDKLMLDKEFSGRYYNPRAPGHQEAIDRINELHHLAAA